MEIEELRLESSQPPLFAFGDTEHGVAELFPAVWGAAEALTLADSSLRRKALEHIAALRVARLSPLIAYLVSTRLEDVDIEMRARVVEVLSDTLATDSEGNIPQESVRKTISSQVTRLRTRGIYSILIVMVRFPHLSSHVIRLLGSSPYAGVHLADIAASRKAPLEVRRSAIRMIGEIGYVDAISSLDRIQVRLESRLNGQQVMPFAPPSGIDDTALLPDVKQVLAILHSR